MYLSLRRPLSKLASSKLMSAKRVVPLFSSRSIVRSFAASNGAPTSDELAQKIATTRLVHEMSLEQMEVSSIVVPWFMKNMPGSYFHHIPESLRRQHLKAVQAIRDLKQSDLQLKIETRGEQGQTEITFISSEKDPQLLNRQIASLKPIKDSILTRVKVFRSLDGELSLNVFFYENSARRFQSSTEQDASKCFKFAEEIRGGLHNNDPLVASIDQKTITPESLQSYLKHAGASHTRTSDPRRWLVQHQLFEKVRGTEQTAVYIDNFLGADSQIEGAAAWITIAAPNVLPEVLMRQASTLLSHKNLNIVRANLDLVNDPDNAIPAVLGTGTVSMLRLLVATTADSNKASVVQELQKSLQSELKRMKWIDEEVIELGTHRHPYLGIDKAEVIVALCSMLHGPLTKLNGAQYASVKSIISLVESSPHFIAIAQEISELFLNRFRPTTQGADGLWKGGIDDAAFNAKVAALEKKIKVIHAEAPRLLLLKMLHAMSNVKRTNFYNQDRYALSFRIDPSVMVPVDSGKPMPYGVFFVHGRNFNAFHCRFRDIARGGLRIVTPRNNDEFILSSSLQFDEVYGLSYAQQLKNKDIPEGGSKGVIIVNTPAIDPTYKEFAMRKSVKAFTDSMLDLMVKDSIANMVDFLRKDELIYLGPDEQVIPYDIDWIVNRAGERGYPIPAACMSSKAGAGINHKTYGVTSEGVVVYLDAALKKVLNIDPRKQPFTIKITGGPDGDVAGNLLKILFREYGDNCKVVGIADGFGVAEDPNGLNSTELLRLVKWSVPITSYNRELLSKDGILMDNSTNEGLARRNTMPFRVKSDAFVPAGGRPATINKDNWHQFLDENGKPSSPLIVEGANIFNTPEARDQLFKKAKVVIVKDSSANKCGVITSSYEVQASMILSKEEFLAIKDEMVEDVIVNLKRHAQNEADLLFRAYANFPGDLPHFSERISNAINRVTDAITDALATVNPGDSLFEELRPLIKENLPKKLSDYAWDRVAVKFPVQYQRNAIASTLASKLVYSEGIHYVEHQADRDLANRAFRYYRENAEIQNMASQLESAEWVNVSAEKKAQALKLLRSGAARTSLGIF